MSLCENLSTYVQNINQSWEPTEKRNFMASISAGSMFAIGWWIIIDAAAMYPSNTDLHHVYHICGVAATIAMFMVNTISAGHLRGESYTDGCFGPNATRVWLFLGLVMSFASLIGSCWILFGEYVVPDLPYKWPGVAVFLQNFFIFLSSITYKFGRVDDR